MIALSDQPNVTALATQIKAEMGLSDDENWTYQQRQDYLSHLKAAILANAAAFSQDFLAVASQVRPNFAEYDSRYNPANMLPYPVDVALFFDSAFDVAGELAGAAVATGQATVAGVNAAADLLSSVSKSVSGVAGGISNTAALAPYLIPLGIVAFLYFAIQATGKDPGGQASKVLKSF